MATATMISLMIATLPLGPRGWAGLGAQTLIRMVGLIGIRYTHLVTFSVIIGNKLLTQTVTRMVIITDLIAVTHGMMTMLHPAMSFLSTPSSMPIMMGMAMVTILRISLAVTHVNLILGPLSGTA